MSYSLGLDFGTSKVAAVILNSSGEIQDSQTEATQADLVTEPGHSEQSVGQIFSALERCVRRLNPDARGKVSKIGITGQMHGVLLWNHETIETSNLVTWQDSRGNQGGFLKELYCLLGDSTLRSGFACTTLAWWAKHSPHHLENFSRASTIHDYAASIFTKTSESISDPTNAASWGLFDIVIRGWNHHLISKLNIPRQWLPRIAESGSERGALDAIWAERLGLPVGISVTNPIGDNQASILGTLQNPDEEISLTLGTSGQLSVVVKNFSAQDEVPAMEFRPFVNNSYLAVAACLCGGSAFRCLVESIERLCRDLGVPAPSQELLFAKCNELGLQALQSPLEVCTSFRGERYNSSLRAAVTNIDYDNFTLANLSASTARGVLNSLKQMLPAKMWQKKSMIIGSGNGLRKSPLLQVLVPQVFGKPLVMLDDREEAAFGAALLAIRRREV